MRGFFLTAPPRKKQTWQALSIHKALFSFLQDAPICRLLHSHMKSIRTHAQTVHLLMDNRACAIFKKSLTAFSFGDKETDRVQQTHTNDALTDDVGHHEEEWTFFFFSCSFLKRFSKRGSTYLTCPAPVHPFEILSPLKQWRKYRRWRRRGHNADSTTYLQLHSE